MKKTIILSEGVKKEMTYEEVLKQFKSMINKHANMFLGKFTKEHMEREDILQELNVATWKAYQEYDGIHAFSTFLTFKLMKETSNAAQKITRKKREHFSSSMNSSASEDGDLKLENLIPIEDFTSENMIAKEMMDLITENINEREQQELACILYPKEYSVSALADSRGITRQAAGQRVKKTRAKLQVLFTENNLVTI